MIGIEIKKGDQSRKIDCESNNFIFIGAGDGQAGPWRDDENFERMYLDEKHIINQRYIRNVEELIRKYSVYLSGIWASSICVIVDEAWEPSEKANKNSSSKIDIKKAPTLFKLTFGYEFVIYMKQYWIDKWSSAQLNAALMSQLLRINPEESGIYKYTEDYQSRLVATFGIGYLEPHTIIPDLLQEDIKIRGFKEASGQISIADIEAEE